MGVTLRVTPIIFMCGYYRYCKSNTSIKIFEFKLCLHMEVFGMQDNIFDDDKLDTGLFNEITDTNSKETLIEESEIAEDQDIACDNTVETTKTVEATVETNELVEATVETVVTDDSRKVGDRVLYIICDKEVPGLLNYIRELGVKATEIFYSINDARNELLAVFDSYRLVVIDTGTGRFTGTTTRAELLDIIGMYGEDNKVTVFYTDDSLKIDGQKLFSKGKSHLDWYKYASTIGVVTTIMQYEEVYKEGYSYYDTNYAVDKELINHQGFRIDNKNTNIPRVAEIFTIDEIATNIENAESDLVEAYKPNIN